MLNVVKHLYGCITTSSQILCFAQMTKRNKKEKPRSKLNGAFHLSVLKITLQLLLQQYQQLLLFLLLEQQLS